MTPPKDSKDWLAATLDEHAALYADTTMKYITEEMSEEERDKEWHHSDLKTKHAIESRYAKELEKAVREARIDEVEGFVKLYREHWEEWEFRAAIGRRIDQLNKESD